MSVPIKVSNKEFHVPAHIVRQMEADGVDLNKYKSGGSANGKYNGGDWVYAPIDRDWET